MRKSSSSYERVEIRKSVSKVLIDYSKISSFLHTRRAESARHVIRVQCSVMEKEYSYLKEGPEGLCQNLTFC